MIKYFDRVHFKKFHSAIYYTVGILLQGGVV